MRILEAQGLRKVFRSSKQPDVEAVRGLDLHIDAGEVLAFLGANGAGKTTAIKMIAGIVVADSGSVRVAGFDPQNDPGALRQIGAVLEGNRNLYWRLTPAENLEYFGILRGLKRRVARRRSDELLARFSLEHKREAPVNTLSRGMQQKLALAVALIHDPKLLLLDEPTLGLDVEAAETVKGLIREISAEGRAVLLTTHQLGVAEEIAQRVAIIDEGRIVIEGATSDLVRRFSGESFRVTVEGALDERQQAGILGLGAWLRDGHVEYLGSPAGLYDVIEQLRPLPLVKVEKDRTNLTGVFLRTVGRQARA